MTGFTAILLCSAVFLPSTNRVGGVNRLRSQKGEQRGEPRAEPRDGPKQDKPRQPTPGMEPTSPDEAVAVALLDLERIAAADLLRSKLGADQEPDAPFMRYFWVSSRAKDRDDFLIAFMVHLNHLNVKGFPIKLVMVAHDVVRIDVRELGWELKNRLAVFERTAGADVFFHQKARLQRDATITQYWPGGKASATAKAYERGRYKLEKKAGDEITIPAVWLPQDAIDRLRYLTYSESPVLMAEWFFVQTARQTSLDNNDKPGIGQLDFLAIRNRDDFFELVGLDPKVAAKTFNELRAVQLKSGISRQNRIVVALGAHSGRAFITLDVFKQRGRGVARRNLRPGEFDHDAEEHIGRLGCGAWVTCLIQAKDVGDVKAGTAVASAPDKIGPDDSGQNDSRDHRVHQGLSCIRCHFADKDGLKRVTDWVRGTFRQGGVLRLNEADPKVRDELYALYFRDFDEALQDERIRFARDYRRMTVSALHPQGLSMAQIGKLYAAAWDRYAEQDLTVEDAARELGVKPKVLTDAIAAHADPANRGATDLPLSSFIDQPPQKMPRLDWEDSYQLAAALAAGIQPPEIEKREKIEPLNNNKKGKEKKE